MAIGDPMTQPIPAVGTAGPTYANELIAFLQEVENRLTVKVPLTSLLIGTLNMNNNALQNVEYLGLYGQASTPSTPTVTLQSFNGDLWWVSPSGAVQITSGNTLNATSVGGIGGNYGGSNPAQLRFVSLDQAYYAYYNFASLDFAHFGVQDIWLYGTATGTSPIKLGWAGGTGYTLLLPSAVPSVNSRLMMTPGGQITTAGIQSRVTVPAAAAVSSSGTNTFNGSSWNFGTSGTCSVTFPVQLTAGSVINGFSVQVFKFSSTSTAISVAMFKANGSGSTQLGSTHTTTVAGPTTLDLGESNTLTEVVPGGPGTVVDTSYFIVVSSGQTSGTDSVFHIEVQFTSIY